MTWKTTINNVTVQRGSNLMKHIKSKELLLVNQTIDNDEVSGLYQALCHHVKNLQISDGVKIDPKFNQIVEEKLQEKTEEFRCTHIGCIGRDAKANYEELLEYLAENWHVSKHELEVKVTSFMQSNTPSKY